MKIGIDGTALTIPYPCGTRKYAEQLIAALGRVDKVNSYVVYVPRAVALPSQQFEQRIVPKYLPRFKRQLLFIPHLEAEKFDLFHLLDPFGVMLFHHPHSLITIHDLGIKYTHRLVGGNWYKRLYTEWMFAKAMAECRNFVVVSRTIKNELKTYFKSRGYSNRSIFLNYHGADHMPSARISHDKQNYFLAFGDFAWRKNINVILKAIQLLEAKNEVNFKIKLLVSAKDFVQPFEKVINKVGLMNRFELVIQASDLELMDLYQQATALLYPSLYEGFGLPIVEAMRCGCPVITSNRGAMKEVAGDSAFLINPESEIELAEAAQQMIFNDKVRDKYIKRGYVRSDQFRWNETAKEMMVIYSSIKA